MLSRFAVTVVRGISRSSTPYAIAPRQIRWPSHCYSTSWRWNRPRNARTRQDYFCILPCSYQLRRSPGNFFLPILSKKNHLILKLIILCIFNTYNFIQNIDIVLIRENTEGEYSGLEHETIPGIVESIKIVTRDKIERIARMTLNYAVLNNRHKVTAVHKANIQKLGDGLFLKVKSVKNTLVVREMAKEEFPQIEFDSMIVDNACMQLVSVSRPQQFDVMLMPNLYGNIISNIACGLVGGPGLVSGMNLGNKYAVFETGTRNTGTSLAGKDQVSRVPLPCESHLGCTMEDSSRPKNSHTRYWRQSQVTAFTKIYISAEILKQCKNKQKTQNKSLYTNIQTVVSKFFLVLINLYCKTSILKCFFSLQNLFFGMYSRQLAKEWPTLFAFDRDVPRLSAFRPQNPADPLKISPTEANLLSIIKNREVTDAILLYERMRTDNVEISQEVQVCVISLVLLIKITEFQFWRFQMELFKLVSFYNESKVPFSEYEEWHGLRNMGKQIEMRWMQVNILFFRIEIYKLVSQISFLNRFRKLLKLSPFLLQDCASESVKHILRNLNTSEKFHDFIALLSFEVPFYREYTTSQRTVPGLLSYVKIFNFIIQATNLDQSKLNIFQICLVKSRNMSFFHVIPVYIFSSPPRLLIKFISIETAKNHDQNLSLHNFPTSNIAKSVLLLFIMIGLFDTLLNSLFSGVYIWQGYVFVQLRIENKYAIEVKYKALVPRLTGVTKELISTVSTVLEVSAESMKGETFVIVKQSLQVSEREQYCGLIRRMVDIWMEFSCFTNENKRFMQRFKYMRMTYFFLYVLTYIYKINTSNEPIIILGYTRNNVMDELFEYALREQNTSSFTTRKHLEPLALQMQESYGFFVIFVYLLSFIMLVDFFMKFIMDCCYSHIFLVLNFISWTSFIKGKKNRGGSFNGDTCVVEALVDHRSVLSWTRRSYLLEYYVKWDGYGPEDNLWIPEHELNCPLLVHKFVYLIFRLFCQLFQSIYPLSVFFLFKVLSILFYTLFLIVQDVYTSNLIEISLFKRDKWSVNILESIL
uniref:Chromo domain-containing protein n=1 Tax=Heterorhabditis bacteriophora TaxID=37862 RepID=A0A1I7WT57_HETBA